MKHFILSLLTLFVFISSSAMAATSPLSVNIAPPVQFPPSDYNVTGLRAGVVGHHRSVYGIDIGAIGNITDQEFVGIAVSGVFNITRGNTTALGLQAAGLTNVNTNKTTVVGVQLAGLMNINYAESSVVGVQLALIGNLASHTKIYGVQAGLMNKAHTVYGIQVGLYNYAESLHGLQIGLINVHRQGLFGISPLINFGF